MKLFYVPLELYRERYTEYQSSKNGVYETAFKKYKIPFEAIRPHEKVNRIKTGVVLDPVARSAWGFEQSRRIVDMIVKGKITSEDVIYFEDFWHPGMEMIPYAASLKKFEPRIFSFWHAQSVDPFDFTYAMKDWMREFELAWSECHQSIFVASPEMKTMMLEGGICEGRLDPWIDVVGLPYDSSIVRKRYAPANTASIAGPMFTVHNQKKKKQVVFSSRWDKEKCPGFFMNLATTVMAERDDVKFIVCTGARRLRSNDPDLLREAEDLAVETYYDRFIIRENLTKQQYFKILAESKVQFNCADQDFISLTILDATAMGCLPLYPNYLTFPSVLENNERYLYEKNNLQSAKEKLYSLIDREDRDEDVSFVYKKQEDTVLRMLHKMGFPNLPAAISI